MSVPGDDGSGSGPGDGGSGPRDWLRWFLRTDEGAVAFVREVLASVLVVVAIGLLLFAISGLWPPMVAVESGSMNPNLVKGDLVFVMEEHRLAPDSAHGDTGVVTHRVGQRTGYEKFNRPGDVIVFRKDGQRGETPIIHRAMFWVNESENWYDKADPAALGGTDDCGELRNCPAPHAGFITKGDNPATNSRYDQMTGQSGPVKPEWIVGTAEVRIPYLGWIRLLFGQVSAEAVVDDPGSQGGTSVAGSDPSETRRTVAASSGTAVARDGPAAGTSRHGAEAPDPGALGPPAGERPAV